MRLAVAAALLVSASVFFVLPATASADGPQDEATISRLLSELQATSEAARSGDFASASAQFDAFVKTWSDVEGEVKTRSASDYRAIENGMARASTALSRQSPDVLPLLDEIRARLEPYEDGGKYRFFDATIIVLREGMEALLVVVALLAFVRRSGNGERSSWIWAGATAGLGASIVLGVAIHELLGKAFSGSSRELLEGLTGLTAAAMLLYVSYWLHSKSSLGAWQRYISEQTGRALAKGSLAGLALLSFLAVFREGGETVLFIIGMTGRISTENLIFGLGIGAAFLAVAGLLITFAGLRIPMRPFFAAASLLTFYLCFKFVGTGIHALQVSGVLSARVAGYLPDSDTLGLFPTWQTTLPQALLLLAGLLMVVRTRLRDRAGLLSLGQPQAAASD
jgi:high-affinity iron transporter